MQVYGPAHVHGAQRSAPRIARGPPVPPLKWSRRRFKTKSTSPMPPLVEQAKQAPDIRQDRVQSIRAQIASGTYETAGKLDTAVNRLLDEIG